MDNDNEAPKDPGVCQQRYTEQDYEGKREWINRIDGHSFPFLDQKWTIKV